MYFEDDATRPLPPKVPVIRPEAYPMPHVGVVKGPSAVTPAAARPSLSDLQPGFRTAQPGAPAAPQQPRPAPAPTVPHGRGPTVRAPAPHARTSPAARTVGGRPVARRAAPLPPAAQ